MFGFILLYCIFFKYSINLLVTTKSIWMRNKMMKNDEKKYITLGNLARIAHIGRDTLSFYNRKGLINPVYVGDNGYKYFLPEQVQTINFIRFYRKLDFPLETIQNMLNNSAENTCESAFQNQQNYLKQKIKDFEAAEKFLETEKKFMEYICKNKRDVPFIENVEEKNFYVTPIKFCHSLNNMENARKMADFFYDENGFSIPEYPICCIIPRDVLMTENFCSYMNSCRAENSDSLSDMTETESSELNTEINPRMRSIRGFSRGAGKFACMTHSGGTDSIFPSIKRLLHYIEENGFHVTGDAYVINSYNFLNITENQNDAYIIQIRIDDMDR